jgi:hypothetical protein
MASGGAKVACRPRIVAQRGRALWVGAADALAAQQPPNPDLLSQPAGAILLLTYPAVLSAGAATAVHQRDEDQGALLAAHEGRVGHRG